MWRDKVRATLARLGYKLEEDLVLAVIWQESIGNPWAHRPEPAYKWLWDVKQDKPFRQLTYAETLAAVPPADFPTLAGSHTQEWTNQRASWGLMQLMGAAAREQGFKGNYLTELCDPYTNLEFGIKHLWNYAFQKGNWSAIDALCRWNGDKAYAAEVLAKKAQLV